MTSPEARARSVLTLLDLQAATRAASGRYLRSVPVRPGVRYWATSQPRSRKDLLGVQFYGEGLAEARRLRARLEQAGFEARSPQTGQATFAKATPFSADDAVDGPALRLLRRELDAILAQAEGAGVAEPARSFRDFMLASPLADQQIALPPRTGDWREVG